MHPPFTEAERQVLIALIELSEPIETPNNTHYSFHPTSLAEAAAYFCSLREDWIPAYPSLLQRGLLVEKASTFSLTDPGRQAARQERLEHPPIWYWYRKYYTITARSPVYSRFCERLYGRDLSQTDFSDMTQIDFLIRQSTLQPGMRGLDLGCGNGLFAEYLSDCTGAQVVGLDYIPEAIAQAQQRTQPKRDRLQFVVGDLDHLTEVQGSFDLLTSIDTLYMPNDLPKTLRRMHELLVAGGKMLIFYTEMIFDPAQSRDILLPGGTGLAKALDSVGLRWRTWDFSQATVTLMRRKRILAQEMRGEFEAEGSLFLYDHLYMESFEGDHAYDPADANLCRYLYEVSWD
ncbi:MAG: class I SAM-dependent methyltransferase [Anaerolineaceae bacterium]|nr:class I SAM-dependent methyltransferase [Anaerolineaceae bacterium]